MSLEKLQKQLADVNAKISAIQSDVDAHNERSGWWGYVTGNNIRLGSYQPDVYGSDTGLWEYQGDHPAYYDLTKQRYELEQQIEKAKSEQIKQDRANLISGNKLSQKQTTVPKQANPIANVASTIANTITQTVIPKATAEQKQNSVETTQSVKKDPVKEEPKKIIPQYKQDVSVAPVQGGNPYNGMQFGGGEWYTIPNGAVTRDAVTIQPVSFHGDNGGLQHADMNILNQRTPATFGQMLAMGNVLQGNKGLSGGIGAITKTMQDADRMNAYQAQGAISGRVQDLLGQGYDMNEARYLALSEYGLENGLDRMAVGITMPEYAKNADIRAKREMDAIAAAGGNYQSTGGLGYVPLGVNRFSHNGDGTMDVTYNGQTIQSAPVEYGLSSIYGAIKGDGSGSSNAATRWANTQDKAWSMGKTVEDDRVLVEQMRSGGTGLSKGSNRMTIEEYEQRKLIDHELALERERIKQESKNANQPVGNLSGFKVYSAR